MTQTGKNFVLGLVSLVGAAGLVTLLLLFGELEGMLESRYRVTLDCPHAAGLREGSGIELNGVPVGRIAKISPAPDPEYPVRILALVDRGVVIPVGALPYSAASLLGGGATLQLEAVGLRNGSLATDGNAQIRGPIRSRLMEDLNSQLDSRMGPLLETMGEFRALARNLNEMVRPVGPGEPGVVNARTAVERLNQVLDGFDQTLAEVRSWLGDEQLKTDVRGAVARFNQVMDQAVVTLDEFKRVAQSIETDSHAVATRLNPALDELARTLDEARDTFRRANRGEGTVAQLLNNPDLYRSLEDAAQRLDVVLREAQLALQKVKAEGVRIRW